MKRASGNQDSPTIFPNLHFPPPATSAVHHHLTATKNPESNPTDGSTDVVRRPRGRPPGSKTKSKPPVTSVTNKPDPGIAPYVLQVSAGSDIVAAVTRFCNDQKTGLCVLNGSGAVSNVSFGLPTTPAVYQGRFSLLSISATILPPPASPISIMLTPSSTNGDFLANFVVSLASPEGLTFGGAIVGPLIAYGTVQIVAVSFNNPIYHQLPTQEDENKSNAGYGSVSAAMDQAPDSGSYGCHLPACDIRASTPQHVPRIRHFIDG